MSTLLFNSCVKFHAKITGSSPALDQLSKKLSSTPAFYIHPVCVRGLLGYNESVDASIKNVFATAAMRFGHTFLPATIRRADSHYRVINGSQTPLSQVSCRHVVMFVWL